MYFFRRTHVNYSPLYGTVDNKATLELADDAAFVVWGSQWRMPTAEEFQELLDGTESEWIKEGDTVIGRKFTASNGNSIFLPAIPNPFSSGQYEGSYWSSSLLEDYPYPYYSRGLYFYSDGEFLFYYGFRYYGQAVRAVLR